MSRAHFQRIGILKNNPDFLAYLSYVLIVCTGEQDSHRAVAGLLLKNSISEDTVNNPAGAAAVAYVRAVILQGLSDKDQMIRQTVGAVITALLGKADSGSWPEALNAVTVGMGSQHINLAEVCAF